MIELVLESLEYPSFYVFYFIEIEYVVVFVCLSMNPDQR